MMSRLGFRAMAAAVAIAAWVAIPGHSRAEGAAPPDTGPDLQAPTLDAPVEQAPVVKRPAASEKTTPGTTPTQLPVSLVAPNPAIQIQYTAAHDTLDSHFYRRAADLLTAIIELAPGFEPAYADRGAAFLALRDFNKAVGDLTKALDLATTNAPASVRAEIFAKRGAAYANLKLADKAAADLAQAIPPGSTDALAYTNRGYSYLLIKNFDQAISDASHAIELKPETDFAYAIRGYALTGKKDFDRAIAEFQHMLLTKPNNQSAVLGLHYAYQAGKTQEEAAKVKLVRLADSSCEPACPEWIAIEGRIEDGTAEKFKSVLKDVGKRKVPVFVDSGGGAVNDSLEIGRLIRSHHLDVVVTRTVFVTCGKDDKACKKRVTEDRVLGSPQSAGSICASACAFIMAAGVQRYVGEPVAVGVHQIVSFSHMVHREYQVRREMRGGRMVEVDRKLVSESVGPKITVGTGSEIYAKVRKFFEEMGVGEQINLLMMTAPSTSMHWLTATELVSTRMTTERADGEQLIARGTITLASPDGKEVIALAAPSAALPAAPAIETDATALARTIHMQLTRLGCSPGADNGQWSVGIKRALDNFNKATGATLVTSAAVIETVEALLATPNAVCTPPCAPELIEADDGKCIARIAVPVPIMISPNPTAVETTPSSENPDGKTSQDRHKVKPVSLPRDRDDEPAREPRHRERSSTEITAPGADHTCSNHQTSCTSAWSYCLSNCAQMGRGSFCRSDCAHAMAGCRSSGTWRTANCLKTGLAR